MHFFSVNELKLSEVELFSFFHFESVKGKWQMINGINHLMHGKKKFGNVTPKKRTAKEVSKCRNVSAYLG